MRLTGGRFNCHIEESRRLFMEVASMENPEMEFLQWLLKRFVDMNDIDVERTTLVELMDKLNEELTPIGGG
jgi:hypothetical protein